VKLKEAEILFNAGVLNEPVIKHDKLKGGWIVTLSGKHKLSATLETARGQVRVFKRLDAAVGVLFELGVIEIKITQ
jgi:hypothetical protein